MGWFFLISPQSPKRGSSFREEPVDGGCRSSVGLTMEAAKRFQMGVGSSTQQWARGEMVGLSVEHFAQLIALRLNSCLNFGKLLQVRARKRLGWAVISQAEL